MGESADVSMGTTVTVYVQLNASYNRNDKSTKATVSIFLRLCSNDRAKREKSPTVEAAATLSNYRRFGHNFRESEIGEIHES